MMEPRSDRAAGTTRRLNERLSAHGTEGFIYDLLGSSLILAEDWEHLSSSEREELLRQSDTEQALALLVRRKLLTHFLATRISTGNTFGLVLGNFRLLERLGAGGMAVVYKAEHIEMRHLVAIKVMQRGQGDDPRLETRFSAEMRAVARLHHPNIVAAMDAGRVYSPDPAGPVLWYLVMEYVPGEDLEDYVRHRGPLPVPRACNLIHQIASALAETHKLNLVHRDIKPSNIIVTPEEVAKLLDFGLSRYIASRQTLPGTVLGTVDFMAPEQARDASQVDIRADIWSLGATLYWALTAQLPFPGEGSEVELLLRRVAQEPPSARDILPELPQDLDDVMRKMMSLHPVDRYQTPQEVLQALLPFLRTESSLLIQARAARPHDSRIQLPQATAGARTQRVLIVDDERSLQMFCQEVLRLDGLETATAGTGEEALAVIQKEPPDLLIIDVSMPGMSGPELLNLIRANPPVANLKTIMVSGHASGDEMSEMLLNGADDYLTKPFSVPQLRGRVQAALRLKTAQDRSDLLNSHLLALNDQLERQLNDRASDVSQIRAALVVGLARLVQLRENDHGHHLQRMARYTRSLAHQAALLPIFAQQIDQSFIEMVSACAPLHDIGKVGLPDHILLKPGKLSPDERLLMQTHTTMPSEMIEELMQTYGTARAFLQMAGDIIRHHHENYDGTGYPDRLAGPAIPLAARIASVADVYDALRCRRTYKPALSHLAAVGLIHKSTNQFDPSLLEAFKSCHEAFEKTFRECSG
ncbi:MAG: protein kinase [Gemmataceae bacterium]